jgi:hypothetical protein
MGANEVLDIVACLAKKKELYVAVQLCVASAVGAKDLNDRVESKCDSAVSRMSRFFSHE